MAVMRVCSGASSIAAHTVAASRIEPKPPLFCGTIPSSCGGVRSDLYDAALDIAAYVLAHGLTMPDRFERTAGCVVAEEIGIAALNALKTGAAFDLGVLSRAVEVTDGHDMPDQVRARLLLARARGLLATNTEATPLDAEAVSTAIDDLRRAIQLHDSCGGKEDLKRAERLLTKIEGNQSND